MARRRVTKSIQDPQPSIQNLKAVRVGFEPTSTRLTVGCSSFELPHSKAVLTRFELAVSTVTEWRGLHTPPQNRKNLRKKDSIVNVLSLAKYALKEDHVGYRTRCERFVNSHSWLCYPCEGNKKRGPPCWWSAFAFLLSD